MPFVVLFFLGIQEQRQCLVHGSHVGGHALGVGGESFEIFLRLLGMLLGPGFGPEADEVAGGDTVGRGLGAVVLVLGPGKELFVIGGRVEKPAGILVAVPLEHSVG